MAQATKPDFGKAGKVTIRKDKAGVEVDLAKGEYLFYRLRVEGAQPLFAWACEHRPRLKGKDFPGHPKQVYEWTWCHGNTQDKDGDDDVYSVGMMFTAAIKYTLLVEHRKSNDQLIETLKDNDYESQNPADSFTEPLRVFVK
ncbi:MAG: hypothetical protein QOJ02_549 [Acidobacteriota bacterium]|jgi:hypothetical protein|nr:hypothetical protein [Acidobacteriota bacterium]